MTVGRQKRALLAWEFGQGMGHVHELRALGNHLEFQGWNCRYALRYPDTGIRAGLEKTRITQSPPWPLPSGKFGGPDIQKRASLTFGQTLAYAGFHDVNLMNAQILAWDKILSDENPDLVVSDFAPALNVASRGKVPVVAVGAAYTAPPSHLTRFPKLHSEANLPFFDDDQIFNNINTTLAKRNIQPFEFLPQIMGGDVQCPCTLDMIDPYRNYRKAPGIGTMVDNSPISGCERQDHVFIYLQNFGQNKIELINGFIGTGIKTKVYIPRLSDKIAAKLAENGIEILRKPADMKKILSSSKLVVHHGGHGLTIGAVFAGTPQLIIPFHLENRLNGESIVREKLGALIRLPNITEVNLCTEVCNLYDNTVIQERCEALAETLLAANLQTSVHKIGDTCREFSL